MAEFKQGEDVIDIHGRLISTIVGANGEVMCDLSDVKQTGFHIHKKSQWEKLSTIKYEDSYFGPDFTTHMLDAARAFMLANKIHFEDEIIMNSIESSKRFLKALSAAKTAPQNILLGNRQIEPGPDEDFVINVANPSPPSARGSLAAAASGSRVPAAVKFPQKGFCLNNKTDEEKVTNGKRPPVSADAEPRPRPKFDYNVDRKEVTVVVTAIDKCNCIWVRDVANSELFEAIFAKTNQEAGSQPVVQRPFVMDKVYMAQEASWFRCKVVKYSPLSVFFLDYGTVAAVNELREVSEELASAPSLAVRITFKPSQYTPRLKDTIRITTFHKNGDGTYFVNVTDAPRTGGSPLPPKTPRDAKTSTPNRKVGDRGRSRPSRRDPPMSNSNPEDTDGGGATPRQLPVKDSKTSRLNSEDVDRENHPSLTLDVERLNLDAREDEEAAPVFERPSFFCRLEDGQRVAILSVKDDRLYLRTRACFERLRDVEKAVERCAKSAGRPREVREGQLVLFRKRSDGAWYRAVVSKAAEGRFAVELMDYVEEHVAESLAGFKVMDGELAGEPMTYFGGARLVGFEDRPLDQGARDVIADYISKTKKFTVSLGFDGELDLYDGTGLLSHELEHLRKTLEDRPPTKPQKIFLKDAKPYKPQLGTRSYVCGYYENSKDLTIVPSEMLEENVDCIIRSEVADETPYEPETQELCVCFHGEDWYRCAALADCGTHYKMFLLDFGNIENVKKEHVRKPDEKITEVPTLALPCVLTGLPKHDTVENALKQKIIEGELYNVDVKEFKEGKYQVEIPSVYKNIRDML